MKNGLLEEIKKIESALKNLRETITVTNIKPEFAKIFYTDLKTILNRINNMILRIMKHGL